MNFQKLEYFLAAAETGNITRAAQKLNISQQALSGSISRLEEELGAQLFDRRQGLKLTYAGREFRDSAEKMLDVQRQAMAHMADISGNVRGELRIGISHTRGQALLPLLLPEFIEKYPNVEIFLTEDSTSELEHRLEHGDLDVLIVFAPFMFSGARYFPLMHEQFYLVVPRTLLAAKEDGEGAEAALEEFRRTQDIRVFRDYPFVLLKEGERIRTVEDRMFREAGFRPLVRIETRNMQTAVALAAEGVGITVCPQLYLTSNYIASGPEDSYIRRRVEICPLVEQDEEGYIAIGYNRERYLSRIAEDFIQMSVTRCLIDNPGE